ncbi:MAG: hypothetical protein PHS93_07490 [Candidatus Omnitrophica bacterium]|nr:hypothetical protein [Candidatus Omnitrophota bacterium]MDD5352983.1 hypothetical protein [Candidatus Omnitrophota bacterium]MDD5550582.1 hypothetical protein [Candidatus Omnitrophota bacterium]
MDNKIKLLVVGLGVLSAISLLIAFQLNITSRKIQLRKEAVEQELAQVSKENDKLTAELANVLAKNKSLTSNLSEIEAKGKGLQDEIARVKERLDLTSKERDSLITKVQSLIEEKSKLQQDIDKVKSAKEKEAKKEQETPANAPSTYSPANPQEAFWAEVLRQKAAAELELENAKTQLKEITFKADELLKERNSFEMELKNVIQQKDDLDRRAAYNEKLANSLSEDLVREKSDKEALLEQLDKIRTDNTQMRARIKDLENTKSTLYRKLDNLEQERGALVKKLGQTENIVSERVDEIVKIKKDLGDFQNKEMPAVVPGSRTVELSPIVVRGKQESDKPTLTGRVLSLNKQNDFVIVDLGENAGVKVGDKFSVSRDNKYIASLEVILMRKDISAADIKESAVNEEVKVGDVVKLVN